MSSIPQRLILVTGATGYVGGRLVPRLLAQGYRVRCLVRDPARLAGRPWEGIEIVAGDVLRPETLPAALFGADSAYYLVHSMAEGERGFGERDRRAARNFAAAAAEAGVRRIIYLGGLGRGRLSRHLRSRQEVGAILRESGVPVTELRAALVVGSGSLSFELVRYCTERVPVIVCPRWVRTPCQPIGIRDLLGYLLAALDEPLAAGRIVEVGGGDVVSYGEMMRTYARVRGLARLVLPVPLLTPRMSAYAAGLLTPVPAAYARPLLENLRYPVVVQDDGAARLFPQIKPMTYEEAVRIAVERTTLHQVETSWTSSYRAAPVATLPAVRLESGEGLLLERRTAEVEARPAVVFRVFTGIGGKRGWYFATWLWELRGWIDQLIGGYGLSRGRRDPDRLAPGDVLDCWRVEEVEPNRLLRMRMELKLPGRGWLEFRIEPEGARSIFTQTAYFQPTGLAGLLYWYGLYPAHSLVFRGMARAIIRRSERAEARLAQASGLATKPKTRPMTGAIWRKLVGR